MRMNKTMTYALACLWELAQNPAGWILASNIAAKQGLPVAYCYKVLETLSRAGLVESGRGQGFRLSRPLEQINCLEFVTACNDGAAEGGAFNLVLADSFRSRMDSVLSGLTLRDMVKA